MTAPKSQLSILLPAFLAVFCAMGSSAWAQRTYIGSESCAACHEDQSRWIRGGVHEDLALSSSVTDGSTGCETCHGPGSDHIEDLTPQTIINFKTESAEQRSSGLIAIACNNTESNHSGTVELNDDGTLAGRNWGV